MNTACSTCLEPFNSRSDISSTFCGHVFHTECIQNWFESGQNVCPQCRKESTKDQIVKLYFSESELEHDLVRELDEMNQKLQEEVNESKSVELVAKFQIEEEKFKLQEEKVKTENCKKELEETKLRVQEEKVKTENYKKELEQEKLITENFKKELEEKKLKVQEEKNNVKDCKKEVEGVRLKCIEEKMEITREKTKLEEEKLKLKTENLKAMKHLDDVKSDSKQVQKALRKQCEELTEDAKKAESENSGLISV